MMNTLIIYSKPDCVWCRLAKQLCADKNISFIDYNLDSQAKIDQFKLEHKDVQTLPHILIENSQEVIGGYSELHHRVQGIDEFVRLLTVNVVQIKFEKASTGLDTVRHATLRADELPENGVRANKPYPIDVIEFFDVEEEDWRRLKYSNLISFYEE